VKGINKWRMFTGRRLIYEVDECSQLSCCVLNLHDVDLSSYPVTSLTDLLLPAANRYKVIEYLFSDAHKFSLIFHITSFPSPSRMEHTKVIFLC
jgi:hypothetical protein